MSLATAFVEIRPETKGFGSNLTRQLGKDLDRAGDESGRRYGNATAGAAGGVLRKAGPLLAAAFTGAAAASLVSFVSSAIGSASDLNETINKANTIFGSNAAVIQKWAEGAATNLGLSKQAALDTASGFGDMLSQIGFSGDQAAKLSTQIVTLSADLGSFNNLPTADVAERIGAAFRGEYDSLQLLIPNINAARVESEALAMTGKDVAKELTAQEKAAAVLAIVHKDGARAAGDFAKTSDGLANQQKILQAEFANVKTEIGQELLPVATAFMGWVLRDGVPALKGLVQSLKDNKEEIKAFALTTAEVTVTVGQALLEMVAVGLDALGYLADGMVKWQGFVFGWADTILGAFESIMGWLPGYQEKFAAARIALDVYAERVMTKTGQAAGGFHTAAAGARGAADAVGGLRDKINTLQNGKTVKISADTREAVGDVDALVRYINSRSAAIRVAGVNGVGGVTARAGGGSFLTGRAYLVGEEGPELVTPASNGTVIPAGQTAQILAGGGDQSRWLARLVASQERLEQAFIRETYRQEALARQNSTGGG